MWCELLNLHLFYITFDTFLVLLQALISLLQWSWCTFKVGAIEARKQVNSHNLAVVMLELEKLLYISKASLRLLRTYINDIYPSQVKILIYLILFQFF